MAGVGGVAHIGLNLAYLVPGETGGTETYARELIPALVAERPDLRLTAFLSREAAEARGAPWLEIPSVTMPVRARQRAEWVRGEQLQLPRLASRAGVDLLHSLANTAPGRGRFKRVVTVHDLIHRIHPEAHFGRASSAMRWLVWLAARRSDRVIAPSVTSREDIVRLLGASPEEIDVVPQGVAVPGDLPAWGGSDRSPEAAAADVRARFKLGERPVVLCVAAMRPHKNQARLIEALALIPGERRPRLVLAGYATPYEMELREQVSALGLDSDICFAGWVSAAELEALYLAASAFIFPSLYEGFGLPVLEAMAHGVPVACSDRGSLAEVAGGAARLFNPDNPKEIAAAVEALVYDGREAERLRGAGRERAVAFTWRATAHGTLASYDRALAAS